MNINQVEKMGSIKKCENIKCENTHDGSFGSGRFCNRNCANSRSWDKKDKLKKSKSAKSSKKVLNANKLRVQTKIENICKFCGDKFNVPQSNSHRQYCSRQCYLDDPNSHKGKGLGGYRKGSGRGKSGWYKGYWCDSTYELVWVIYNLDNGIKFQRNKKKFPYEWKGKIKYYYPDFEVNNQLIEIKGYSNTKTEAKLNSVSELKVLFNDDLKKQFKWVRDNYEYKNVWELYDDYRPKYTYECSGCGIEFNRERKAKTDIVYCSRKCSGKFHIGKGNPNGYNQYNKNSPPVEIQ